MNANIGSFNASKLVAWVMGRLHGKGLTVGEKWPSRVGSKLLKQGLRSLVLELRG